MVMPRCICAGNKTVKGSWFLTQGDENTGRRPTAGAEKKLVGTSFPRAKPELEFT